jgi:membrane-associated HD superfamily phosphohydrolase
MLALYSLSNLEFNILILLSLVPLLLHCICYQFVLPARHHNPYQRKMLELSILALCIVLCMTVSASYIQLNLVISLLLPNMPSSVILSAPLLLYRP